MAPPRTSRTEAQRAFTLIELLTVIAIIAVLMGLLFPAVGAAMEQMRKAQAKNDAVNLTTACKAYYTDYGTYPMSPIQAGAGTSQNGGWDTCYGDPDGDYPTGELCNILRALDAGENRGHALNPRQQVYFEGKNVKDPLKPKSGFLTADVGGMNKGDFVDPWGNEYVVFLDANYDESVTQALSWFYYVDTPSSKMSIAACSLGKDKAWGTKVGAVGDGKFANSDDQATWQ